MDLDEIGLEDLLDEFEFELLIRNAAKYDELEMLYDDQAYHKYGINLSDHCTGLFVPNEELGVDDDSELQINPDLIIIRKGLDLNTENITIMHELAHYFFPWKSEKEVENWAQAYCNEKPNFVYIMRSFYLENGF